MPVGFGFSVGDFINAINLVHTVIDALSASSESSSELRELFRQLHSLETALRETRHLEVDESLHAEVLALKQSAAQCQLTVSDFLDKTSSYQPHLLCINGSSHTLQSKWKRVQWALCKKKHILAFKNDLLAHTESIQLLLATVHMKNTNLGQKIQQDFQKSFISQIQEGFSKSMQKLSIMSRILTRVATYARECVENSRSIISMNIRIFQLVLNIQSLLLAIPGQIQRQQPVYLNDAQGRHSPFHLEFIRSAEALISVLSINFKRLDAASEKIRNGEFSIHDTWTKRDIDLSQPWEECFSPGQHVEMSMIFDSPRACSTSCPGCHCECEVPARKDVEW